MLQTGGGSDKFDLTDSSLGGAAREYKMYFKEERTQDIRLIFSRILEIKKDRCSSGI